MVCLLIVTLRHFNIDFIVIVCFVYFAIPIFFFQCVVTMFPFLLYKLGKAIRLDIFIRNHLEKAVVAARIVDKRCRSFFLPQPSADALNCVTKKGKKKTRQRCF